MDSPLRRGPVRDLLAQASSPVVRSPLGKIVANAINSPKVGGKRYPHPSLRSTLIFTHYQRGATHCMRNRPSSEKKMFFRLAAASPQTPKASPFKAMRDAPGASTEAGRWDAAFDALQDALEALDPKPSHSHVPVSSQHGDMRLAVQLEQQIASLEQKAEVDQAKISTLKAKVSAQESSTRAADAKAAVREEAFEARLWETEAEIPALKNQHAQEVALLEEALALSQAECLELTKLLESAADEITSKNRQLEANNWKMTRQAALSPSNPPEIEEVDTLRAEVSSLESLLKVSREETANAFTKGAKMAAAVSRSTDRIKELEDELFLLKSNRPSASRSRASRDSLSRPRRSSVDQKLLAAEELLQELPNQTGGCRNVKGLVKRGSLGVRSGDKGSTLGPAAAEMDALRSKEQELIQRHQRACKSRVGCLLGKPRTGLTPQLVEPASENNTSKSFAPLGGPVVDATDAAEVTSSAVSVAPGSVEVDAPHIHDPGRWVTMSSQTLEVGQGHRVTVRLSIRIHETEGAYLLINHEEQGLEPEESLLLPKSVVGSVASAIVAAIGKPDRGPISLRGGVMVRPATNVPGVEAEKIKNLPPNLRRVAIQSQMGDSSGVSLAVGDATVLVGALKAMVWE